MSDFLKAEYYSDGNLSCPACGGVDFRTGPEAGLSQNIECIDKTCGARWNHLSGLKKIEPINDIAQAFVEANRR